MSGSRPGPRRANSFLNTLVDAEWLNHRVKFVAPVLPNQMVSGDDKPQSCDLVSVKEVHVLGLLSKDLVEE